MTGIAVFYILGVSVYMIWHRAWFSPDQFFAFAIIGALIIGRGRQFLSDWIPAILLLFGYEYLRGLGPVLTRNPNVHFLMDADRLMFGRNMTVFLQQLLTSADTLHWYDYLSVVFYISHFVIPWFVAYVFWIRDRNHFRRFVAAFMILSYMAFITFVLFPAMPPWMASANGYLPPLEKIMDRVMASFAHPIDVPSVYRFFGANLVAPMPSLHAAYPFLIFLFTIRYYRKFTPLVVPYVVGVWFSVVYLGEHYVIDVIAGALYAYAAFKLIHHLKFSLTPAPRPDKVPAPTENQVMSDV